MDKPFVDVSEKSFITDTPQGQGNTTFSSVGIGTGSKVFRADSSGMWLGASEFANAPFRVDMNGNVTMTSASIGGYVEEIGGNYTSATGTGARVQLLPDANTGIVAYDSGNTKVFEVVVGGTNVGDVTIGNYSGNNGMFWDDSANTLNIRGNMNAGTISGTTIDGSLFRTSSSGTRVQLDANGDSVRWYDSGNDEGLNIKLTSSTDATIQTFDGRDIDIIVAGGDIRINDARIGEINRLNFNVKTRQFTTVNGSLYLYEYNNDQFWGSYQDGFHGRFDQNAQ